MMIVTRLIYRSFRPLPASTRMTIRWLSIAGRLQGDPSRQHPSIQDFCQGKQGETDALHRSIAAYTAALEVWRNFPRPLYFSLWRFDTVANATECERQLERARDLLREAAPKPDAPAPLLPDCRTLRPRGKRETAADSHAASANSPAISLFTRCTVPLPTPTSAATLRMPLPALRCVLMAFSTFGDTLGRPSFFPCWRTRPGRRGLWPGTSIFPVHQTPTHLDHGSAHGRRGIVPCWSQCARMPAASSSGKAFATWITLLSSRSMDQTIRM